MKRKQRSNCQRLLDHRKSTGVPKKIYFCFIDYTKAFDCIDHNQLWKILKEMRIPDHLTCLLRNLYAGQEATVRTRHVLLIYFASIRSLPFLSFIMPIFAWNVSLISPIFLKRSLVFPILLFSSVFLCIVHLRKLSYLSLLFSRTRLLSCFSFSLVLGCGISLFLFLFFFFVGSNTLLSMVVQLVVILVFLQEKMTARYIHYHV